MPRHGGNLRALISGTPHPGSAKATTSPPTDISNLSPPHLPITSSSRTLSLLKTTTSVNMAANEKPAGTLRYEEKPVYTTSNGCPVNGSYIFNGFITRPYQRLIWRALINNTGLFCFPAPGISVQSLTLEKPY